MPCLNNAVSFGFRERPSSDGLIMKAESVVSNWPFRRAENKVASGGAKRLLCATFL